MAYEIHDYSLIFPAMPDDQFEVLVEDIRDNGCREPVVLFDGKVLDGRHRYKACVELGIEPVFVQYEGDDPLGFAISHNLSRRHMNESQRAMVAARLSMLGREGRPKKTVPIGTVSPIAEKQAKLMNTSRRGVFRAKKVLKDGTPELADAVKNGEIAVSVAAKIAELDHERQAQIIADPRPEQAIKKAMRQDKEQALADKSIQQSLEANTKLYGVIYADPPWRFETYSENGMDRSADNHYPTMSVFEMLSLDVPAADNCAMFMWATVPMLPEALDLLDAWGFEYKSQLVWVKDRIGTGHWVRNKHEILLIATKGHVPAPAQGTQPPSVFELPVGRHSEKPAFFADLIASLYPNTPKLEMFARIGRVGWDVMGNEAPDDD